MRALLIVIGVILILGGLAKGVVYYVAFERLPDATYQVWSEAEHGVQGMTSDMVTPFADAVGSLGVDVPARPPSTGQTGPSAAVRQQFEAIAHDMALLSLLQNVMLGIAAGSVFFALARVLALLEARLVPPAYGAMTPSPSRKY